MAFVSIIFGFTTLLVVISSANNRFGSFAPSRSKCKAAWFVDGEDYMSAVADALELASKEIFIADWQLSPHIYMKRSETGVDSNKWRLDTMLLSKAGEGVKIHILLYSEPKILMDLGNDFARQTLKHPNITVLLHPDGCDVIRHITTLRRWTHHEKIVVVDQSIAFIGGIDLAFGRWDNHKHELKDNYPIHPCIKDKECSCGKPEGKPQQDAITERYQCWVGKDYGNPFQGGDIGLDHPLEDYMDRTKIPRMPWHDVGCAFTGHPAYEVAKHFIQRYNAIKQQNVFSDLELVDFTDHSSSLFMPNPDSSNLKIQVLRSVGEWSAEQILEFSIYNAYLHSIKNAEHFIYIENQFFISSQPGMFFKVQNQILSALAGRILRAYDNYQTFHAMIVMPLKPGFPGKYGEKHGAESLEAVTYWNNLCLNTLYKALEDGGIPEEEILDYISVYGLRTHGILNGEYVTEIVYVHSKVMIVDDRITIMGSANINDRSMLGGRDSEIAVIVEDTDMIHSTMGGKPFEVGKFSHSLRCHLLKEHLGLLDGGEWTGNVEDPLKKNFIRKVADTAHVNDDVFNRVFGSSITPKTDKKNYEQLKEWMATPGLRTDHAREELKKICGRLVPYPRNFLINILEPSFFDMAGMYTLRNEEKKYIVEPAKQSIEELNA